MGITLKPTLIAIVVLAIGLSASFGMWRYTALKLKQTKDALDSANATIEVHKNNTVLSERISHDYQSNIDQLNADIKRLRSQPAHCVTITTETAVHSEAGRGREHGEQDGISSGWLTEFSYECEQIRIERNSCKQFVNEVWESRQ